MIQPHAEPHGAKANYFKKPHCSAIEPIQPLDASESVID
jgi:hypothetical protein